MSEQAETRVLEVGGRKVEISRPDKLLFPDDGISKYDLAEYYARIAPTALRHYRGRALTMHRFPDGIGEEGFFQKQIGEHFPDWVDRVTLPKRDGEVTYVVAYKEATLVYLADQACIEPHLSLSRIDRPQYPDRMIFDLDPSDEDFGKVRRAAMILKDLLDRTGLNTYIQTTGSRGLHLVVPLDRHADFESVRAFTHALCRRAAAEDPELMTTEQRKNKRGDRVFLEDLRNAYGQTAVAPYAVRAKPGAPIATPIRWEEVDSDLHPQRYHIGNIFQRMSRVDDPWQDIARHACRLPTIESIPASD
jgi:bifunctional non-homologous end joining protein LigD